MSPVPTLDHLPRRLERMLWRSRVGLLSPEQLERGLVVTCERLVDERFERALPFQETSPYTSGSLRRFEDHIERARLQLARVPHRAAVESLKRSHAALLEARRCATAHRKLESARSRFEALETRFGLAALRPSSTLRSLARMLEIGWSYLEVSDSRKAGFMALLCHEEIARLEVRSPADEAGRRELEQRLGELEPTVPARTGALFEALLDAGHLVLADRLLEELEVAAPPPGGVSQSWSHGGAGAELRETLRSTRHSAGQLVGELAALVSCGEDSPNEA